MTKRAEFRGASLAASVTNTVASSNQINTSTVRGQIEELFKLQANQRPQLEAQWVESISGRIKKAEKSDIYLAHNLMDQAKKLWPNSAALKSLKIKPLPKPSVYAKKGLQLARSAQLTAADAQLDKSMSHEPEHSDTAALKKTLKEKKGEAAAMHQQFSQLYNAGKFNEAQATLNKLLTIWKDNPAYKSDLDKMAKIAAGAKPCISSFAGYGKSGRAQCYDLTVKNQRGPVMVVVPGARGAAPYAVGKFEVSIGDWNRYCKLSKKCAAVSGDSSMPVTGVTVEGAQGFASWLTKTTGYTYSVPTHAEWMNAASGGGKEGNNDYNCTLRLGSQLVKGRSILTVKTGQPNRWGVVNYVGNVQELVKKSAGTVVAGGHYQDVMSSCTHQVSETCTGRGRQPHRL